MQTKPATRTAELDTAAIRRLAVAACADPRTVVRVLRGEPVKGMAGHRIRETLYREGLLVKGEGER